MYNSSSYNSLAPTTLPFLPHEQTRNPNSSSSSYYCPFPTDEDQTYQFDFNEYNFLTLIDPPNNYSEANSLNYAACLSNERIPILQEITAAAAAAAASNGSSASSMINPTCMMPPVNFNIDEFKRDRMHAGLRIAFRMKTELEIVDDGYRWRKYGKKKVKSSPNPRNYYKCSTVKCNVKKRIERAIDDSNYVITTYEGVHNHESPSIIHHATSRPTGEWTFQHLS